jgi:hypothetical protein
MKREGDYKEDKKEKSRREREKKNTGNKILSQKLFLAVKLEK